MLLLKAALSQPQDMKTFKSVLSAEKARLPPLLFDVNRLFSNFVFFIGSAEPQLAHAVIIADVNLQTPVSTGDLLPCFEGAGCLVSP
jgi:hypothetical protein